MLKFRHVVIVATIIVGLLLIGAAIYWFRPLGPDSPVAGGPEKNLHEKLRDVVRALPGALAKANHNSLQNDLPARMSRAYATLEADHKLRPDSLAKELPVFVETLLQGTGTSELDKACALFATGKFSEAESQALVAKENFPIGSGQAREAISALELAGSAAMEQVQYARALEHFRNAAVMTSRRQNPAEWARVNAMVAHALSYLGGSEEAWYLLGEVHRVREEVLGAEHPDSLNSRLNLADALFLRGRFAEAEREYGTVLGLRMRTLDPEHPDCLIPRMYLANALNAQRKYAEAEREFRAVLKVQERLQGREHPDSLRNRNNLAIALSGQGRRPEAEREYRTTLELREKTLGPEHPSTLKSRMNLAIALDEQGKHAEAERGFRLVLGIQERVLGREQPDVCLTSYNLAACLTDQGKKKEALEFARWAFEGRSKVLGGTHRDTRTAEQLVERLERER